MIALINILFNSLHITLKTNVSAQIKRGVFNVAE
jgi:hypothetical protein